jgi:hypothetical protein
LDYQAPPFPTAVNEQHKEHEKLAIYLYTERQAPECLPLVLNLLGLVYVPDELPEVPTTLEALLQQCSPDTLLTSN